VRVWFVDTNWAVWNNSVQKFGNPEHSNCHKHGFSLILQSKCWKTTVWLFFAEEALYNKQIRFKQNTKAINKQNHVNKPLTTLASLLRKEYPPAWSVYLWRYQHFYTSLTFQTTGHDLTHFLYETQAETLVDTNQSQRRRFAFRKLKLRLYITCPSVCTGFYCNCSLPQSTYHLKPWQLWFGDGCLCSFDWKPAATPAW
jgi:hypothetical protein